MGNTWKILVWAAVCAVSLVGTAFGQSYDTGAGYAGYGESSLIGGAPGGTEAGQTPVYYPYWNSYLDNMQREGGYQSVTGNYPGSVPVTSYYPSSAHSTATAPDVTAQAGMYYSPQDYYASTGAQGQQQYPQQQYPQQYPQQQPQQYPQAYQQQYPQGYAAQTPQTYEAAPQAAQMVPAPQYQAGKKKRRLSAKHMSAAPAQYQQYPQQHADASAQAAMAQQQAVLEQQQAALAQQQQAALAQQQQAALAQQQGAYGQQGYQQQQQTPYAQQAQYQQTPYGQQAYQQQPGYGQVQGEQAPEGPYSGDPMVQDAQRKAYERAVARQRAAELAAQQQAASQELQQTQQMYMAAQQKLREQEQRQRSLQDEYYKKSVAEAYEQLRASQRRYYDLMGVSGQPRATAQAGPPAQGAVAQLPAQQPMQYPQAAQVPAQQPMQYPQAAQVPAQQPMPYPQAAGTGGYPVPAGVMTPTPTQPGQATPLQVQGGQAPEASSGGLWGTLKEIFSPPTTGGAPSPRQFLDKKGPARGDASL